MPKTLLLILSHHLLVLSVFSQTFSITINPGAYLGGYEIDSNGHGIFFQGSKTFQLAPGPHYLNTGTGIIADNAHAFGSYIDFMVTVNGTVTEVSPSSSAQVDTADNKMLNLITSTITIDPSIYKGKYEISAFSHIKNYELSGKKTIALIRAQRYYFEDEAYESKIIPGFTSGFYFDINEAGTVVENLAPSYTLTEDNKTFVLNITKRKIDPSIFPAHNNGIMLSGYGYTPIKKPTEFAFITGLVAYAGYLDNFGNLKPSYFVP